MVDTAPDERRTDGRAPGSSDNLPLRPRSTAPSTPAPTARNTPPKTPDPPMNETMAATMKNAAAMNHMLDRLMVAV